MRPLTRDEHHVLAWLGREDVNLLGPCKGKAFDELRVLGLATIFSVDLRGHDYCTVGLTEAGFKLLRELGPWHPMATTPEAAK